MRVVRLDRNARRRFSFIHCKKLNVNFDLKTYSDIDFLRYSKVKGNNAEKSYEPNTINVFGS